MCGAGRQDRRSCRVHHIQVSIKNKDRVGVHKLTTSPSLPIYNNPQRNERRLSATLPLSTVPKLSLRIHGQFSVNKHVHPFRVDYFSRGSYRHGADGTGTAIEWLSGPRMYI